MYQKICDRCSRPSFSSSESSDWLCTICGKNLTSYPFFEAMTMERIHIITHPLKKKLDLYRKVIHDCSNKRGDNIEENLHIPCHLKHN